jgi:hypothetical protein
VYKAIRLLDSSSITSDDFVQRLMAMSIPIPVTLQRLLAQHQSHGCATFQDFVSALQPYFNEIDRNHASMASNIARQPAGGGGNIGYHQRQQQQQQQQQNAPMALQNHGDILTWSGPRSGLENKAQMIGAPRHKAAPHLKETSGLFVSGIYPDKGGSNSGGGGGGRGGAHLHEQVYGSHDIIGWHDGSGSQQGQTLGGMPGSSGKMHGNALKLYGGTTPYGTDVDLGDGLDKSYGIGKQTRKGGVRGQREHTGAWMTQRATSGGGQNQSFRGVQAPFGTDIDVRKR